MAVAEPVQDLTTVKPVPAAEPEKSWLSRVFSSREENAVDQEQSLRKTVSMEEVIALVHYVVETGEDEDGNLVGNLDRLLIEYKRPTKDKEEKDKIHTEIVKAYSALTAATYRNGRRVNGRTVLNSQRIRGDLMIVGFFGLLSFVAAASTHILNNYYEVRSPDDSLVYIIHQYVLVYLLPAFWGALGATVFLAMKIGEHARSSTFDSRKLRGQMSRIALGAVFAAVLVHLFYSTLTLGGFESIGPSGVAFLAGLGVKAIYSAFEALVNKISDWIAGFDPKQNSNPATPSLNDTNGNGKKAGAAGGVVS